MNSPSSALRLMLFVLALLASSLNWASAIETYEFASPVEEARFQALSRELRCTVCQNQSLADSDAPLAQDLRRELFEMIRDGRADMEIRQFMVDRYGEFVLYRPRIASHTILLWAGPFIMLLIGIGISLYTIKRRRKAL
ncbi:MAG: cytochrome c-type biogenesis protein [Pseudomonadota bacterium]